MAASVRRHPRGVAPATALLLLLVAAPRAPAAEPAKTADPPARTAGHRADATGGPDGFGYTYFDQTDGCAFDFVDVSGTGSFILDGDDTASGAVALAAPIDLYGTSRVSLAMAANGYLTTDPADGGLDVSNDCPLPAVPSSPKGTPGARIYPLHDDLDLEPGIGAGYVEYFPVCPRPSGRCAANEDCTVFQWHDVAHFPGGGPAATWDMEVILYHRTHDVVYQIGAGNPETGAGSTTGLQDDPPPTTALTYGCDVPDSVPDDTAVCIAHPNPVPAACEPVAVPEVPAAGRTGLALLLLALGGAALLTLRRRS